MGFCQSGMGRANRAEKWSDPFILVRVLVKMVGHDKKVINLDLVLVLFSRLITLLELLFVVIK